MRDRAWELESSVSSGYGEDGAAALVVTSVGFLGHGSGHILCPQPCLATAPENYQGGL